MICICSIKNFDLGVAKSGTLIFCSFVDADLSAASWVNAAVAQKAKKRARVIVFMSFIFSPQSTVHG
jgi:hypothetical protein